MQEKKPINVRVGRNIQMLREERHYTQEELSEKLGITPNHLSAIERGVSGASLKLLESLCQALSTTADHILFGHPSAAAIPEEWIELLRSIHDGQTEILKLGQTIQKTLTQPNE